MADSTITSIKTKMIVYSSFIYVLEIFNFFLHLFFNCQGQSWVALKIFSAPNAIFKRKKERKERKRGTKSGDTYRGYS